MEIVGLQAKGSKPGSQASGSRLQIGERFSTCGKFIITPSGQWKEVPPELAPRAEANTLPPEFKAISPDGKNIPVGMYPGNFSSPLGAGRSNLRRALSNPGSPAVNSRRSSSSVSSRVGSTSSPTSQREGRGVARSSSGGGGGGLNLVGSRPSSMSSAVSLQRELARKLNM